MRVVRLHAAGDLRLSDEEPPTAGPGETLVQVTDVGLCGSDLHWFADGGIGADQLSRPLVPGHELAGVVAAGPRAGTPVAIDPAIPDGSCQTCRRGHRNLCPNVRFAGHGTVDGGLREVMAWPTDLLHPLPDTLTTTDGAILEPLGVAIHAIDLSHVRVAARVAVVGCGPIGLLLAQTVLSAGVTSVLAVDPLTHRLDDARKRGAELALTPDELRNRLSEPAVDVAFEVAGNDEAVELAMSVVRPGGRVVLVGIPTEDRMTFPASLARRKGLTIAFARRMKDDVYERGIRLVESGRVDLVSLVTERYPLERSSEAFRAAVQRSGIKVVVRPSG